MVVCASTGNTSASAAAYAARAGLPAIVLVAESAARGKLIQARALGARVLAVRGSFDQALDAARRLTERGDHVLVNSLNPDRVAGQQHGGLRDRRGPRQRTRRLRPPLRRRRQHDGVHDRRSPSSGSTPPSTRSRRPTGRARSRPRSGSSRPPTARRSRRAVRRYTRCRTSRSSLPGSSSRAKKASSASRLPRPGSRSSARPTNCAARASSSRSPATGSRIRAPPTSTRRRRSSSTRIQTRSHERPGDGLDPGSRARYDGQRRLGVRLRRHRARPVERARGRPRRRCPAGGYAPPRHRRLRTNRAR